jgi:hypothetical protein
MQTSKFFLVAGIIMIGCLIMPLSLSAQSIWLDQGGVEQKSFAIEILKPNFDGDDNTTFATSAIFLSGRIPVSNLILVAELPFAHFGIKDFDDSQTAFGNPYFGLEIRKQDAPLFVEMGLRAPLASSDLDKEDALGVGTLTEFDRAEAFIPDVFAVLGRANYYRKSASDIVFRLRGGPTLLLDAGDNVDESEFLLDYSAQVGYDGAQFSRWVGSPVV